MSAFNWDNLPCTLTCKLCDKEKPLEDFAKDKGQKYHRDTRCTKCMRIRDRRRISDPQFKKRKKQYDKEYVSRPEAREKIRNRENLRYKTDVGYAISCRISSIMNESLKNTSKRKQGRHWEGIVGYTLEELMKHLESKFYDCMSWENRNLWHIDHIIPRSAFNITSLKCEDFKKCWALKNLQPLWWWENLAKRNKIL